MNTTQGSKPLSMSRRCNGYADDDDADEEIYRMLVLFLLVFWNGFILGQ